LVAGLVGGATVGPVVAVGGAFVGPGVGDGVVPPQARTIITVMTARARPFLFPM
jgi:hypothetical protein